VDSGLKLGHQDPQHAVPNLDFGLVGLHMAAGKRDRPAEHAVATLGPMHLVPGRTAGAMPCPRSEMSTGDTNAARSALLLLW
jgi:hypothetical protein